MTDITNSNATAYWGNTYNVCQRSGRKYKPGTLIQESYTGLWVHPDHAEPRHPQLAVRVKAERLTGSIRPEPAPDTFITTAIDPATYL